MLLGKGHAAAGQASVGLHGLLTGEVAAPHRLDKAGVLLGKLLDLVHRGGAVGAVLAVLQGAVIQVLCQGLHGSGDGRGQLLKLHKLLLAGVAADQHALAVLDVAGADLQAHGHALHLPLGKLPAGLLVAVIQLDAGILADLGGQLAALVQHAGLVGSHGHDHDLNGRDGRGQDQAVVVAVGHDDGADQAGGRAPGGLERILQGVVAAREGHVIGAAEFVTEVVARAALQGLAVLHHRLDGVGRLGTGKLLLVGLAALDNGDAQVVLGKIGVAVQLLLGLGLGLLGGLVDGVTLLPPELTGAQERAGGFLPADNAAPLVVQHRQVAVGVQHMAEMVAEHRLAGGAHRKALLQRVAAAGGDPGDLGRKAVDQLALLLQQALGDEHGHGHVLMAGGLEASVQIFLDVFPDGVAIGAQHNKALDAGILDQLGLRADVGVPLGEVDLLSGDRLDHFFLIVCHFSFPHTL